MVSIDKCVTDALGRLEPMPYNKTALAIECEIYVWPQTWSDMICGSGGFGAQSVTSTPTVVVVGPNHDVCVYHGGRWAYKIDNVNENFWKSLDNRYLPGTIDNEERAELCSSKEKNNEKMAR